MRRVVSRSIVGVATAALMVSIVPGSWAVGSAPSATSGATRVAPGNPKAYQFVAKVNGVPVHWNRCRVIDYRLSTSKAPAHALQQLKHAIRLMHKGSGLKFKYLGRTKIIPGNTTKYPGKTRLVVGWSTAKKSTVLASTGGYAAGVGSATWMSTGEIVQGSVVLNRAVKLAPGFGAGPKYGEQGTIGQLLMHELGHAVGLAHVKDDRQIMYPELTRKVAQWGAGDLNGLAQIGRKRSCFH